MLHRCDQVVREIDIVGSHPMSISVLVLDICF